MKSCLFGLAFVLLLFSQCFAEEESKLAIEKRLTAIDPTNGERQTFGLRGTLMRSGSKVHTDGKGRIFLLFAANAYLLVRPDDIVVDSIIDLPPGGDPSGRMSMNYVEIKRDAKVELHVGRTSKSFRLSATEREFFIDTSGSIVYVDELPPAEKDTWRNCYKRVYVADCYCCRNNRFRKACYGWVGCPNPGEEGWYDRKCCP